MRFEVILRMLIRLGLAEWFVANNVTIMKAFFTSIGNLVNLLSAGSYTTLTIDSTQADIIKDLGFGESLIMLIQSQSNQHTKDYFKPHLFPDINTFTTKAYDKEQYYKRRANSNKYRFNAGDNRPW